MHVRAHVDYPALFIGAQSVSVVDITLNGLDHCLWTLQLPQRVPLI